MKLIPHILVIFSLTSCADIIQVSHKQDVAPEFEETAKVALIFNRGALTAVDDPEELEETIADCVKDELAELPQPIQVISPQRFRQTVFPGIAYDLIPSSPESISLLLDQPDFQQKLESLDIRYLILVDTTQKSNSETVADGFGGPGGGVFWLFLVWDNEINLESTIMHIKRKMKIGNVSVKASGHSFIGIFTIVPMGWPDTTEGSCCNAFGKEIANFFRNSQFTPTRQEKR